VRACVRARRSCVSMREAISLLSLGVSSGRCAPPAVFCSLIALMLYARVLIKKRSYRLLCARVLYIKFALGLLCARVSMLLQCLGSSLLTMCKGFNRLPWLWLLCARVSRLLRPVALRFHAMDKGFQQFHSY